MCPCRWNSNAFSEQVNPCVTDAACTYEGRQANLSALQDLIDHTYIAAGSVEQSLLEEYMAAQCSEGWVRWTGMLCDPLAGWLRGSDRVVGCRACCVTHWLAGCEAVIGL